MPKQGTAGSTQQPPASKPVDHRERFDTAKTYRDQKSPPKGSKGPEPQADHDAN